MCPLSEIKLKGKGEVMFCEVVGRKMYPVRINGATKLINNCLSTGGYFLRVIARWVGFVLSGNSSTTPRK